MYVCLLVSRHMFMRRPSEARRSVRSPRAQLQVVVSCAIRMPGTKFWSSVKRPEYFYPLNRISYSGHIVIWWEIFCLGHLNHF